MSVSGCIRLFHLCVFVTCFQDMFVLVHNNLTGTYFQEMFAFQVPGKNVKWKALIILQNKLNFILFQHLQTTAFSFIKVHQQRSWFKHEHLYTQSKFFPQAFAREQQINENGKLQSRTDCLQPKAERWNRNQPTRVQRLLPHANRVASLWCIHYSTFWYARCSTLSPFQSRCSKMLQLHKLIIIELWKALPHCWMIQWGTEHLQAICVSPM